MMAEMITGGDANQLAGSTIFSNTNKCLTCGELTANGFTVSVSRAAKRLVDKSYVTYSSAGQVTEHTLSYHISLRTSGEIENEYLYYEYIIKILPDNISDFPNYNQNKCIGYIRANATSGSVDAERAGSLFFPTNGDTNNVILSIYKVSPGGNAYKCGYTIALDALQVDTIGGQFVNQFNHEIQAGWLTDDLINLQGELVFFKGADNGNGALSTKNLRKEINDILNDNK